MPTLPTEVESDRIQRPLLRDPKPMMAPPGAEWELLPTLPDLGKLKSQAQVHKDHFVKLRDDAQSEIDKADQILAALSGGKDLKVSKPQRRHPAETYLKVLTVLGQHRYAGAKTLSSATGFSQSTVTSVARAAEQRGHAVHEKRGQQFRYRLTTAGEEFVTRPEATS